MIARRTDALIKLVIQELHYMTILCFFPQRVILFLNRGEFTSFKSKFPSSMLVVSICELSINCTSPLTSDLIFLKLKALFEQHI